MSKIKLEAARELIVEQKYDEARSLLKTIDHPTAKKWLVQLDTVAPPPKSGANRLIALLAMVALGIVLVAGVAILALRQPPPEVAVAAIQATNTEEVVSEPTVETTIVPTERPTLPPTWTPIATNTATATHTPQLTSTDTPIPSETPAPSPTVTNTPCRAQEWADSSVRVINIFLTTVAVAQQSSVESLDPYLNQLQSGLQQFRSLPRPACLNDLFGQFESGMEDSIAALGDFKAGMLSVPQVNSRINEVTKTFESARTALSQLGGNMSFNAPPIQPRPTQTPLPSRTPVPTRTPIPSPTPVPPQIGRIGPIWDSLRDESFTIEVALNSVEFSQGGGYESPSPGSVYAIASVTVINYGPGALRMLNNFSFQVKDANGALRNPTFIFFRNCDFDFVDLTAGGRVTGCVAFEVPQSGALEFIYAPYQYEGLQPGRYVSLRLR